MKLRRQLWFITLLFTIMKSLVSNSLFGEAKRKEQYNHNRIQKQLAQNSL